LYKFEKDGTYYIFKAYELGLIATSNTIDGVYRYELTPTSMLQGKLCGMCGDFNQDQSNDLHLNSDSGRNFYTRAVIPTSTCDSKKLESISNDFCLTHKKLSVNRHHSGVTMTCTSATEVRQCAEGCHPESTESRKVCFTCTSEEEGLPRISYRAPRWDTFDNGVECDDYFQRVEVPTRCIPDY